MSIGRAALSLCSWFMDLPDVNGGEASGEPLLRNSKWMKIFESLSGSILLDLPCRKYPRGRHRSSGRINQLPRTRTGYVRWVTKQWRCLAGRSFRHVPRSSSFLSVWRRKWSQVFPQVWLREQHLLGLRCNGSEHCSGLPRRSSSICPWTFPQTPHCGDVVLWWGGSKRKWSWPALGWRGIHTAAEKLPSMALLSPAKGLRKKALVFTYPGKGRVSQLRRWTEEYRIDVEKPILKLCIM